jgi:hypothetical protein
MGHRARVSWKRSGTDNAVDLGEKELDIRPILYGRAQFEHDGKIEIGHIERIDPSDWDARGIVPQILVVKR